MPTVRVIQRKLGREKAEGIYHSGKKHAVIEIDPRQTGKDELDPMIHESLHHSFPFLDEPAVAKGAKEITAILWEFGYRRTKQ